MTQHNITQFDQDLAELQEIVGSMKLEALTPDEIKQNRLCLKKVRVAITKKGKELREDSNAYSKAVIAREKELIEIIEPVEEKLETMEEEIENAKLVELRKMYLTERRLVLSKIGDNVEVSDLELCKMDDEQFDEYVIARRQEKAKQDFLKANGYVESDDFKIVEENGEVKLYKLVNKYTK